MIDIWKIFKGYLAVALAPVALIVGCDAVNRLLHIFWATLGKAEVPMEGGAFLSHLALPVLIVFVLVIILTVRR